MSLRVDVVSFRTSALMALALFGLWVAVLAVPGLLLAVLILAVPLAVPLGLLATLGLALVSYALYRRSRIAPLLLLLALVLVYGSASFPRPSESAAARAARWIQFFAYRPELDRRAALIRAQTGPHLVVLAVDGFVATGSTGFVYDAPSELLLASSQRSDEWRSMAALTELGDKCDWTAEHMYGPYYAYSSSC